MSCELYEAETVDGVREWRCRNCPRVLRSARLDLSRHSAQCPMGVQQGYEQEVARAIERAGIDHESLGLGDLTAAALSAVGITKDRWSEWWGEPCDCTERQEKLNKLGHKIVGWLTLAR